MDDSLRQLICNPTDRKIIHLWNPHAGGGKHASTVSAFVDTACERVAFYQTSGPKDASRYVKECCLKEAENLLPLHWIIHGGDGTVNEVINGIFSANAQDRVLFSVVAAGSGNDFLRTAAKKEAFVHAATQNSCHEQKIDALSLCTGAQTYYALNMLNIGFDCSVVTAASDFKKYPLISGSMAYILGILRVLIRKETRHLRVVLHHADQSSEVLEGNRLLVTVANGMFCGGGFCAAPAAKLDDGLMDVLLINDVTRRKFCSLVGDYRRGTHVDVQNKKEAPSFQQILTYRQCVGITIEGLAELCADGEVFPAQQFQCRVLPQSLRYVHLPF